MIEQDKNMTRCEKCGSWIYMNDFMHVRKLLSESLYCKFCEKSKS